MHKDDNKHFSNLIEEYKILFDFTDKLLLWLAEDHGYFCEIEDAFADAYQKWALEFIGLPIMDPYINKDEEA